MLVGDEEQKFLVHKDIICNKSDFFRAAVTGPWKEGKTGVVRLPEVLPAVFEVYVGWLYTDQVDVATLLQADGNKRTRDSEELSDAEHRGVIDALISSFALGTMLQDVRLRNSIIDEYISFAEAVQRVANPCNIEMLCDAIPDDSTLMKLCVDYAAVDMAKTIFAKEVHVWPVPFVIQIALAAVRDCDLPSLERSPSSRPRCFYHEHVGGEGRTQHCSENLE